MTKLTEVYPNLEEILRHVSIVYTLDSTNKFGVKRNKTYAGGIQEKGYVILLNLRINTFTPKMVPR